MPLPGGGYASAVAAVDLAAIFLLGPAATAWLHVAATLAAQGLIQRRSTRLLVHNLASSALVTWIAGTSFIAAGGRVGVLELPSDLWPMAVGSVVYFALDSLRVVTSLAPPSWREGWRAWQRVYGHGLTHHASFLALGGWIAVVALHVGPWSLPLLLLPLVVARHAFAHYVGIRGDLKDFVRALSEVLDEVDPYTRQHSVRVATYAVRIARGMGASEREVEDIETAALVHDLGKIAPQHQRILQKPGTLTHEDQRTLRGHPGTGAGIIGKVGALRRAAEIVRLHHERPDGKGYPLGLSGDRIPLGARILNVADAFDAMTSDRPYRRALDLDGALAELERGAGTQFDRRVIECLLRLQAAGRFPKLESPSSEELQSLRWHASQTRI
ncbi:MAG: HD-GYP domain-containing protein [Candidatus Eisenbacteria bacterium]|uniref:HD-GYP domain-containing protein n=1 Tax=Eiseniibacteriota bacterium TaxID=2212470 RepID=A0A538U799_UNCEI|nr:MAG: HD-GYP domain-containing protein [Candidatus Eisenbacteria bacterium]